MSRIGIVPVNAVDAKFLERLSACLEESFLVRAHIERTLAVPRSALNAARGQLFASTLTARVRRAHADVGDAAILAITSFDLYKTSHRFIFGDADEAQGVAIVSVNRLRPEFYGEQPDANLVFQRALKECAHELGHVFGLRHCYNARCAMYYSNSIFETDNKMPHFCEGCDRRLTRRADPR
ncbi:MAG: archaemetzincin family Zn-dependent metalloprotease [Candidatus Eremiobacteraeota bacterium]|nr:archaemetzincin family Zn-dependent metalloprotease [Candidatus Eremiobacteraeota bacterium]